MPEIEVFEDKSIMVGKRKRGKDESLEDAIKTMERFADWLALAPEKNPWLEADALNAAMLYGMLAHLRAEIDRLIALGGEDARAAFEFIRSARRNGAARRGDEQAP